MPGNTKTLTVTNAADVPVTAVGSTQRVTIAEDSSVVGWPTANYIIKKPTGAATGLQRPKGSRYQFQKAGIRAFFSPGEVVGYVRMASGTTTFYQDEEGV